MTETDMNPLDEKALEAARRGYERGFGYAHDECLQTAIRAYMAALDPAPGWRTMDSAPKDGTEIVVARFKDGRLTWAKLSRWTTADEAAAMEGGSASEYEPGWADGDDEYEYCYPSHWTRSPLPAAPMSQEPSHDRD